MKQIDIPFAPEMKQAVLDGKKWITTRTKKYGEVGDWFMLDGNRYELTHVEKMRHYLASNLIKDYVKGEGFDSMLDFVMLWDKLHPRKKYDPDLLVTVHIFKAKL